MKIIALCVIATALAGCSWLPAAGPTAKTVISQANQDGQQRFALVEVDDRVVDALFNRPTQSFDAAFGRDALPPPATISVGDSVVVSIWEGGTGTLFGETLALDHATTAGARGATMPEQVVPRDGKITVPFAGRISIVGMTAAEVQQKIRKALLGKTQDPQVMVTVPISMFNTVTIVGEVIKGAMLPLSPKGERILDVIAQAGGIAAPIYDVFVTLTRAGVAATIPYHRLISDPAENVIIWPGDDLTVFRTPRTFEAFGATGRNAQIPFEQSSLTLTEALGKSAGLTDEKADPAGVFLLREEPPSIARMVAPTSTVDDTQSIVPVVYHFDLSDAKSYFLAQRFAVENNDVVYVAPAQADAISKFFALISEFTSPIVSGAVISNAAHSGL